MKTRFRIAASVVLIFAGSIFVFGQKQKEEIIQAVAMGTSTQLGRVISVELRIAGYTTDEDKTALVQAFQAKGSEGVARALDKMKSIGRIAVTGTLGYDVSYIRSFDQPDGSKKIRFITERPIRFGEAWSDSDSQDYDLSMGEIIVFPDKKQNHGQLYPAAKFSLDKQNELKIELYQNPWKLVDIKVNN